MLSTFDRIDELVLLGINKIDMTDQDNEDYRIVLEMLENNKELINLKNKLIDKHTKVLEKIL